MALESGLVATGDTILASDHNKLRNDVLTNHTHATGEGGVVDHADLTETDDMSGMGHRHEDIDVHLIGSGPGPNSIDNPGGDQGVHGLATAAYVAGSLDSQLIIQAGTGLVDNSTSDVVTFPVAFSTLVSVVITPTVSPGVDTQDWYPYISASDTTSFTVTLTPDYPNLGATMPFNWIAVGTKT